jgi:hypothetical protein
MALVNKSSSGGGLPVTWDHKAIFNKTGTHSFLVPDGVTQIMAVVIGVVVLKNITQQQVVVLGLLLVFLLCPPVN